MASRGERLIRRCVCVLIQDGLQDFIREAVGINSVHIRQHHPPRGARAQAGTRCGVIEFRSRFNDQGIGSENLERLDQAREMPGAVVRSVPFSVGVVVADSAQVAEELARGDRPFFLRNAGQYF